MRRPRDSWDYLIVTASNRDQARAYETQLKLREELGLLADSRRVRVVADPEGKRIGSGGSTVFALLAVLNEELGGLAPELKASPAEWLAALSALRILVIHAGGDSRRLPAYAPCGKIFIPVPGETDRALPTTLFDRQLPTYLGLGENSTPGQVVVTSGDVLLTFDPSSVSFQHGITGLGCYANPEEAAGHGVYCIGPAGRVRWYLQKPSVKEQGRRGAIDRYKRAILDIGVLSLDAATAVSILQLFDVSSGEAGRLEWSSPWQSVLMQNGLDFYREICCALGAETTLELYRQSAVGSGSTLDETGLRCLYERLSQVPFHVQVLRQCSFLHFGTTQQIIDSGTELVRRDRGVSQLDSCLTINSHLAAGGALIGSNAWVESCRIEAPLRLGGRNLIAGIDVQEPLELESGDCLDVVEAVPVEGSTCWFVRCYNVADTFKGSIFATTFAGRTLDEWTIQAGASLAELWPDELPKERRTVWNARLFPSACSPLEYRDWLWMLHPERSSRTEQEKWRTASRFSLAEIAGLTDFEAFYRRRSELRSTQILTSLGALFRTESGFSAAELALVLSQVPWPARLLARLLAEARWHSSSCSEPAEGSFAFSRILHTAASAVRKLAAPLAPLLATIPGLLEELAEADRDWLQSLGLLPGEETLAAPWVDALQAAAFDQLGCTILYSGVEKPEPPRNALRSDEIVWGRAPARLDLGGGWTDTPPYSLENGGSVINAAVNLNGQPPIQCYARVIEAPIIRIGSIDLGTRVEIRSLDRLLDYREPTSEFGLAKAALALCGFDPTGGNWKGATTLEAMLGRFGGGIELTTLAAIPKGSGLGTSSIMGAVVLSVVSRVMGRTLSRRDLFHAVLRLEQALTTGGGWQDQVGGAVDGVKLIDSDAGLIPDIRIHYVPPDVLDPTLNGSRTLLYYTGITRLAKNILQDVVGRYLDRDRAAMTTLRQLHGLGSRVAEAMARKDGELFGDLIDLAWNLNKQLDPHSSNEEIEKLLGRLAPYLFGAKLLGAGGGGFLLMMCKSPEDAVAIRRELEYEPPNERARFFDFSVSPEGLVVSVC